VYALYTSPPYWSQSVRVRKWTDADSSRRTIAKKKKNNRLAFSKHPCKAAK